MIVNKINFDISAFHQSKKINDMRMGHLQESLTKITLQGLALEFGVWSARSTNIIANKLHNQTVHGFDSFEGLPEKWDMSKSGDGIEKGHFAVDKLPEVKPNIKLWKGWFDDTIPVFKKEYIDDICFLHIDCDLYSSTKTIFDELNNQIVKNTIIVFDEFYPWGTKKSAKKYDLWYEHEYLACKEWVEEYDREFEVVSHNIHQQCCIKITK